MIDPLTSTVPDVAVAVNGRDLPERAYRDLLDVSVEEHLDGPSAFTLRFSTWDDERLDFGWADGDLFEIGGEVEIQLGHVGKLGTVMVGDIVGLDLDIAGGEAPSLAVRGYDRRHRMRRQRHARTFVKMKDSDIAAQIAMEHGLQADVVDSGIQHEHVTQDHVSDLEFLTQRAAAIGYELLVVGRTFHFRPHQHGTQARLTVDAGRDLLEFSAQLSASEQVTEVEVRGWDPLNKEPIVGKSSSGDETSMGSVGGPEAARRAFGKRALTLAAHHVASQEEADRIAREQLQQAALGFVQGHGTCLGRTDLRDGLVIDVQGAGLRFSGAYYITSTSHRHAAQRGYRTAFSAWRNAT